MRTATLALGGGPMVGQAFLPARADRNVCATFESYALLDHFEVVGRCLEQVPLCAGRPVGRRPGLSQPGATPQGRRRKWNKG